MAKSFLIKLSKRFAKPSSLLLLELFVAVSLTVNFFYLVRPQCVPKASGNTFSALTFSYLSANKGVTADDILPSWRTRLIAPMISSWFLDRQIKEPVDLQSPKYHNFLELARSMEFQNVFGTYHALWLFACFLMLIVFRKDALLIMVGVFAGLMYNLAEPAGQYYFPWDMPTLFFFTLACLLFDRGRIWPLLPVIWLGGLFKETTLCCSFFILLGGHWDWKKRIAGFLAVVLATFGASRLLLAHYGVQAPMFPMNNARTLSELLHNTYLWPNLHFLFSGALNSVLFANAGALLLMMLIPWKNRRDIVFRVVILVFAVGQMLFGVIYEFRVWYELLPLGWMLISEATSRLWAGEKGLVRSPSDRTSLRLKRSHWLTMGILLVMTTGAFVIGKFGSPNEPTNTKSDVEIFQEMVTSAEQGNLEAQYNLAVVYDNKQDYTNAATWYERAAEKGYVNAQLNLGVLLCNVRQDFVGAVKWFQMAAARGNPVAQYNLGVIYWSGQTGKPYYPQAFQLFQAAARQGDVNAQQALGKIYLAGVGGNPPDYVEAYKWSKLATLRGDGDARNQLKACSDKMSADQITEAEERVKAFQGIKN